MPNRIVLLCLLGWIAVVGVVMLTFVASRNRARSLEARITQVEEGLSVIVEELDWRASLGNDKTAAAQRGLRRLYDACVIREAVTHKPTSSLQDLKKPLFGESLVARLRDDPWGNSYWFERLEPKSGAWSYDHVGRFKVWSAGPDGLRGTDDDITYTETSRGRGPRRG